MSGANPAQLQRRRKILNKRNHTHQVSHLFPFPNQNEQVFFISNVNLQADNNVSVENAQNSIKMEDIKIESRVVPVLTKTNGFPRIIQEVKINIGGKILTLTNMTTNLNPSALTDEYFSQIVSTLSPHTCINEYKIDLNEDEAMRNDNEWQPVDKIGRAEAQNVKNLINSESKNIEEENINVRNDAKIMDLSKTIVNNRNESNDDDDEKNGENRNIFTIKKKITKHKNEL